MFELAADTGPIDIPELYADDLVDMRYGMDHGMMRPAMTLNYLDESMLKVCEKYDMPLIGCMRLRALSIRLDNNGWEAKPNRLKLFRWAAKLDCLDVAVRVLSFPKGIQGDGVPWCMPGAADFDIATAKTIRSDWVHAVHEARRMTLAAIGGEEKGTVYWTTFVGYFAAGPV